MRSQLSLANCLLSVLSVSLLLSPGHTFIPRNPRNSFSICQRLWCWNFCWQRVFNINTPFSFLYIFNLMTSKERENGDINLKSHTSPIGNQKFWNNLTLAPCHHFKLSQLMWKYPVLTRKMGKKELSRPPVYDKLGNNSHLKWTFLSLRNSTSSNFSWAYTFPVQNWCLHKDVTQMLFLIAKTTTTTKNPTSLGNYIFIIYYKNNYINYIFINSRTNYAAIF